MHMDIGKRIKHHRKLHHLTLTQLQEKTGINNGNLSRIERGEQSLTNQTMQVLADAFGITIGEMLQEIPEGESKKPRTIAAREDSASLTKRCRHISSFNRLIDMPIGSYVLLNGIMKIADPASGQARWSVNNLAMTAFAADALRELASTPEDLVAVTVPDDTMIPRLFETDRVVIDTGDKAVPTTGGVFAIVTDTGPIELRRLYAKAGGGMMIVCDNDRYPATTLNAEEMQFVTVIGRVKASQGTAGF